MPPYIAPEKNALSGFWGKPTSTLDWCEENYALTYYIAEFCESLSSANKESWAWLVLMGGALVMDNLVRVRHYPCLCFNYLLSVLQTLLLGY